MSDDRLEAIVLAAAESAAGKAIPVEARPGLLEEIHSILFSRAEEQVSGDGEGALAQLVERRLERGMSLAFDALGVPPLIPPMPEAARIMLVVHQFAAIALIAVVAVHVSAVLRHELIDRNRVLARMWPPFGRG